MGRVEKFIFLRKTRMDTMQLPRTVPMCMTFIIALAIMLLFVSGAWASSSYFTSQGCTGCHSAPVAASCNACHAHGTHANSAKNSVNVVGTTNKSSYAPGETVTVTISGGYRTGWFRAVLYDQNTVELARSSSNDSGMGSSAIFPAILSAPAPTVPGSYSWKVAWYGNQYDAGGAAYGPGWTPDGNNPGHGFEIVDVSMPFTVTTASLPAPVISSVAANSLPRGAVNRLVTIDGSNLAGATVGFSNSGISGGTATVSATSISLPVSVAVNAATGTGTITVTTASGSATAPFNIIAASIPAPVITSVSPGNLPQWAVNQAITIKGANLTGATVSFSNNGIAAGPATVSDTSISLPLSIATTAPTGQGTVTVTTASGSASAPFNVTSAAIASPAVSAVVPNSIIQGAANEEIIINGANLTGATVSFSNAGVIAGPATIDNTFISVPVTVAANAATGNGVITITTFGGSASAMFTVLPRGFTPTLIISALADGSYTTTATINISGAASAIAGIQSVTVNGQGVVLAADGSFSTALVLNAGANTITVSATDKAGNQKSDTRSIYYDPIAPVLTVAEPADNSTSTTSFVSVIGSVNETSSVVVKGFDGNPQSAAMTGNSYSSSVNLTPGLNTIDITATDLAGNTSSAKRTVTYETAKFTLNVTNPSQDMTTGRSPLILMGTVTNSTREITVTIAMGDKTYSRLVTNGIFRQRLVFTEAGLYPITITARDAANNSSTVTRNVIYLPAARTEADDKKIDLKNRHPFGWADPQLRHPEFVMKNGVSACLTCHSIDQANRGRTMSCYKCHGRKWQQPQDERR
jgi:hypothetical protein